MRAFYSPTQAEHDPEFFLVRGMPSSSAEQPERAERLLAGLDRVGIAAEEPQDFGLEPVLAVHSRRYIEFLSSAHDQWMAQPGDKAHEVVANIHPCRAPAGYPTSVVGRAGWHMGDTACPVGANTFRAALASANSALAAAHAVVEGEQFAYGLCRPPGHHAFTDMASGFCFLNNSAVAAQYLRRDHERVAILDVDVHHGNGTQDIFYRRGDVLTVSIHRDPVDYYPFYWGYANQIGEGDGDGFNLNLPLSAGTADSGFLTALEEARNRIHAFAPSAVVVALGLDASEHDPLKGLALTTVGFGQIGQAIAELDLPTVLVQEGGYLSDALTDNLAAALGGIVGA
jgi:acetoin utilization deacetylase AcuC-like enzyme